MNIESFDRPGRRPRRLLAAVAGLVVASVTLSGCVYSLVTQETPTPTPTRTQAPVTDGVPAELLRFYEQKLVWTECGIGLDCTSVTAPLDWENPNAGEIQLAVARHTSAGTPLGSLLLNPGGPGGSGVQLVTEWLDQAIGFGLINRYDVIGFDPRGVGKSTAVKCLGTKEMDSFLFDIPKAPRGTPAWEDELLESARGFAEACEANSGGILPHISTVNSAHDMDLLRGVLGDEKLNYIGFSYGTFLGATYAKLHPDRVGRLVLDGAVDPSISGIELGTVQAIGFESALRAYMTDCLTQSACPFSGTVDDGMADLGALLASVDAKPLPSRDGRMLGADALLTAIVAMLYLQDNWVYLTMGLTDALAGDPEMAFLLADFYFGRENGEYTDNSEEAFRAYNCIDYPLEDDPAAEAAARDRIRREAPTIARYWDGPDSCSVWPHPPTGTRGKITAPGTAPIIVIGTTNDPATPYVWSVSLAGQLESGVLITRVGEGHTGYKQGNTCVDRAVEAFFLEGTVPEDGLRCG